LSFEPARSNGSRQGGGFVLYLEGPRDRDILRAWARRVAPPLARNIARASVILGGRQPARAASHFRALLDEAPATRGLCVLDRDGSGVADTPDGPPGLEFFTWGRRHIESYLLVPGAIRRALRLPPDVGRVERSLQELLPAPDDEAALVDFDAKRLLARHGPLSRSARGATPSRIARAMRPDELHPDVLELFQRMRSALGLPQGDPQVLLRANP
jgi:hypothetical protein